MSIQHALNLHEDGHMEKIIPTLRQQIEQEPNDMAIREKLGDIYYAQEKYKEARRQYRYIFERRRHAVDVALKLVEVYLCLPNRLRQAYNVLRRTVHHNSEHLMAWLRYANFCRVLIRDDEDVDDLYAHIESISAGDLERELTCAADHLFTGQLERAQEACARALVLAEDDSRVYHLLYEIYLEKGLFWLADAALQRVFALEEPVAGDSAVQLLHDRAMLEIKSGDPEAAIPALSQAVDCADDPQEQLILCRQLALLQMQIEAYADALVSLNAALDLEPGDVSTLYSLVFAHQQMTDCQAALRVLREQLLPVVGPEDQEARHLQGTLHLLAEEPEAALTIFEGLVEDDKHNADYHYGVALAHHQLGHDRKAKRAVARALRRNRQHAAARALYDQLHAKKTRPDEEKEEKKPLPYFDPLDLEEFLDVLDIDPSVDKLARYIKHRYWKERDPRGAKPEVPHRTIVMMLLVMGIKDWNLNQLHSKLRSRKHGGPLRQLVGLPADPEEVPDYTTFNRRINALGVYPLKFLMRTLVREAVSQGYIDVSHVMLDTSLIAAYSDLARFFPDSSTGFSEEEGDWSYPKKWTGRVFGFKLSLASAKDGEPIDADVVTANLNDTTLGKQNVRRLGRLFAPLDIRVEFVLGDAGYCSNPLRELVGEVLGAVPLFHFNPRNGAKRRKEYTYLDDPDEWLEAKRKLRALIERSFAQLKQHFGLKNLCIRGLTQVAQYLLSRCTAYIACVVVAHRVGRPDLKASPSRLLWSY
jgi:tetratricopeptide (TPR) repeat protein